MTAPASSLPTGAAGDPAAASRRGGLAALLLTAAAYALAGWAALLLAAPPSYASPLWPAAGIALACVLRYGAPAAAGVALGSIVVHGWIALLRGAFDPAALLLPALGAMLQALIGAALVRRLAPASVALAEPRDVAAFFALGGPLACVVSASIGTAAMFGAGTVDTPGSVWWTWWVGDSLGVLIGAPAMLTLIGEPRDEWATRRATVGLPLLVAMVLLGLAMHQVAQRDDQRARSVFERDAAGAAAVVRDALEEPLHTLQALHDLFALRPDLSGEQMRVVVANWLQQEPKPQAIAWSVRVPREQVASFEAEVRAAGLEGYRVFDREAGAGERRAPADHVVAIRYIEPLDGNRAALGVNALSVAPAREAIERAAALGSPAATAGFRLAQEAEGQTGVVIYHPVYDGTPRSEAQRRAALRGVVSLSLRVGDTLAQLARPLPDYLRLCLFDTGAGGGLLAGAPGCDQPPAAHALERASRIDFGGRPWELRISAAPQTVPGASPWSAWLFSLGGLVATALLGALLLTITGRTRRIELAVRERTARLQHEVDERTRTEAALRESEQRLRNILDHAPIGVVFTDLAGHTRDSNPRFREITGYSADELAAMAAIELTHPDDRAADVELVGRLIRGEIPLYRRRKRYRRKDGGVVWVQTVISLLRDTEGRPHRIVGVVEDISEHLKLQQAEDARAAAEAANRAKSDFLSRMSHELRTPLNAMLGFTQLLELDREQPLSPMQRGWTAQAQQAGWHLLRMINDTLDLSRVESGTLRLETRSLELGPLLAAARSMIESLAADRRIVISEHVAASLAVRGDETRVKQVLVNLLSNAVKYNVDGGRVEIAARAVPGSQVEIEVTDSGPGLSPQQVGELFQPFNRLGREASGIEGTGIGLVISQRLAELMGGSLRARSELGVGSSFVLALPLAVDIDPTATERYDDTRPDLPRYRRRSVLYIEDNETNAEVMRGILLQRPQIELRVAPTAGDGFSALRDQLPDLILLDMHLPDLDGLQVLRRLKLGSATAAVPVVVVSADATRQRIGEAMADGAEQYLTKPVNVVDLLRTVDDVLDKAATRF